MPPAINPTYREIPTGRRQTTTAPIHRPPTTRQGTPGTIRTGYCWEIIRDGSDAPQSRMPAFGGRLTDEDISAILKFIKTRWGPAEREYQQQLTEQDTSTAS